MAERQMTSFPGTTRRCVRSLKYSASGAASLSGHEPAGARLRSHPFLTLQSNNKCDLSSAPSALRYLLHKESRQTLLCHTDKASVMQCRLCNREKWGEKKWKTVVIALWRFHSTPLRSMQWDCFSLAVEMLLLFQTRARQRERPPLTRLQQRNVPAPGFDGDLIVRIKTVA